MIYYAHCISIYNTPQEERDMETLNKMFPNEKIYNPNNGPDAAAYKERGMEHFFELVRDCGVFVFRGLPNGMIPAGVYKELEVALKWSKPIIELPCLTGRQMSVEDTRLFLKEIGYR